MSHSELFPYMRVADAEAAIAFYTEVFGGRERMRLSEPSGRIGHAELEFGAHVLMVCDEFPEFGILAPQAADRQRRAPMSLHIHVDDCDAVFAAAVERGAEVVMKPTDQFYGERTGVVRDPWGHEWMIGSELEKLTTEEMQRRYDAMCQGSAD